MDTLKKQDFNLKIKKCTEKTKQFRNITCASDSEISQKLKFLQFTINENQE